MIKSVNLIFWESWPLFQNSHQSHVCYHLMTTQITIPLCKYRAIKVQIWYKSPLYKKRMKDVEELSLVYLWTKDSLFQKIDKMNLPHNTCTSWVQVHLYIILPTIHPEYVTAPGILRFPIFRTPFRKTIDIYKLTVKERWTPVK